jgi:hypothetical protein
VPKLRPDSRVKLDRFEDLLAHYTTGEHSYKFFAARVSRRLRGEPGRADEALFFGALRALLSHRVGVSCA